MLGKLVLGDIVDEDDRSGIAIKTLDDRSEAFLACSIPNL